MLSVRTVPYQAADARRLWAEEWRELEERYGPLSDPAELEADGLIASFVGYLDAEPVGTVAVRFVEYDGRHPEAELKRLYVRPEHRGSGYARVLMGAAEEAARRAGATRLILETGDKQPEAVALYRAIGYSAIPNFGKWASSKHSMCMAKEVPTRVVVISGTIGAGKTAVAGAAADILSARGARHAWIDADALAQAGPADPGDPYNQDLMFEAIERAAPAYRRRGLGIIIVARVVEDALDRDRYARAFRSEGGLAEVTVVRVTAPEEVRRARIEAREPVEEWVQWSLERTVELEEALDELDLEDYVIENVGRSAEAAAAAVLDAVGWSQAGA